MGSVDLTHVSGASSTREVPYARFHLVVIYGAGWDATTLNSAENRATYAYAHHRGCDIARSKKMRIRIGDNDELINANMNIVDEEFETFHFI